MHLACEDILICYSDDFSPPFLELSEVRLLCSNFYLKLLWTSEFPPDLLVIAWVSAIQQLGNSIFQNEMAARLHAEEKAEPRCHEGSSVSINTGLFPIQLSMPAAWDASLHSRSL